MEFELKGALKKYSRMRSFRQTAKLFVIPLAFAVPWFYDFGRTDTLICLVGAFVFVGVLETELRLKTMQVRLAGMDDKLHRLIGDEHHNADDNLILELNDW